ncbi:MAG TPA: tetratricopeptide repeat protein [Sphingomicrobium sp.]|nr:tetratricopeptide repeat protein [Sphingomicrobium sp.]
MSLLTALVLLTVQPASTASPVTHVTSKDGTSSDIRQGKDPLGDQLVTAMGLIKAGRSAEAIPVFDQIIAAEADRNRNEKRVIYSARSMTEAILYAGLGASRKQSAVILDATWSAALFGKGFALIDLSRPDDAKTYLDKAIQLAPMNSQYLAERGEWFKNRKDWANAYNDFQFAATAANFAPEQANSFEQRRAWRGMAYARTEQGKLEEARGLLEKCLKLDANGAACQHELSYVNGLSSKAHSR